MSPGAGDSLCPLMILGWSWAVACPLAWGLLGVPLWCWAGGRGLSPRARVAPCPLGCQDRILRVPGFAVVSMVWGVRGIAGGHGARPEVPGLCGACSQGRGCEEGESCSGPHPRGAAGWGDSF